MVQGLAIIITKQASKDWSGEAEPTVLRKR
jgi:hypothetical protein